MRTLLIGGTMDERVAKTPRPHMLDADEYEGWKASL